MATVQILDEKNTAKPLACCTKWAVSSGPNRHGRSSLVRSNWKSCARPDWCRKPMERKSVAKKNANLARLESDLRTLNKLVREDLFLPSLRDRPPRVQGYGFRFFLVLPLLTAEGRTVF